MPFKGFEPRARMRFARNPLRTVIAQVRFPHLYALEEPASVGEFQKLVSPQYPMAIPRDEGVPRLDVPGLNFAAVGPYRFRDASGAWLVALTPDAISLETTEYSRFEEFSERFSFAIDSLVSSHEVQYYERIGIRYVNEMLPPDNGTCLEYVVPSLVGVVGEETIIPRLRQSLQELLLELNDDRMNIRHGVVPSEGGLMYVLDIDAFVQARGAFRQDVIFPTLQSLKDSVWSFFRGSVTDALIRDFGGEEVAK
ncbi:MAG: TIGR04255 family protein [Thermoleophilia bacterium]|nr:TIGR04255 family protein [Thermoleophilia bacterium]